GRSPREAQRQGAHAAAGLHGEVLHAGGARDLSQGAGRDLEGSVEDRGRGAAMNEGLPSRVLKPALAAGYARDGCFFPYDVIGESEAAGLVADLEAAEAAV